MEDFGRIQLSLIKKIKGKEQKVKIFLKYIREFYTPSCLFMRIFYYYVQRINHLDKKEDRLFKRGALFSAKDIDWIKE